MPTYVVERYMPAGTSAALRTQGMRATEAAAALTVEGTPVAFLGIAYIHLDETCFLLFDGVSIEAVENANRRAGLPFDKVSEAVYVAAEDLSSNTTDGAGDADPGKGGQACSL